MENNPESSIFDLGIDEESKSNLSAIAQWTNINAVIGIAGIVISITGFVITLVRLSSFGGSSSFGSGFLSLFIGLAISLALNVTLLHAALHIKKGVSLSSQHHFVTGLSKLVTYFKIFGIILIVVLVIVVLAILVVSFVGGFGRSF